MYKCAAGAAASSSLARNVAVPMPMRMQTQTQTQMQMQMHPSWPRASRGALPHARAPTTETASELAAPLPSRCSRSPELATKRPTPVDLLHTPSTQPPTPSLAYRVRHFAVLRAPAAVWPLSSRSSLLAGSRAPSCTPALATSCHGTRPSPMPI
jgi:hypothetical protein